MKVRATHVCVAMLFVHGAAASEGQLGELVATAQSDHPSVESAAAAAQAAGVDINAARAARYPYLTVTGAYGSNDTSTATASVVQPLYRGGLTGATVRERKAVEQQQLALLEQAKLDIGLQVANAYLQLARATALTRQWQSYVGRLLELQTTIERRIANGVSSDVDAETVETRVSQAQVGLATSQAEQRVARSTLTVILQRELAASAQWPADTSALTQAELDQAMSGASAAAHPTVQLERAGVQQQVALADQQRAALWPELSLQYSRRFESQAGDFTPEDSVQLVLSAQTNNALAGYQGLKAARSRVAASELRVAAAKRSIQDLQLIANTRRQAALSQQAARDAAVVSSNNQRESYFRQFQAGRKSWLEVLNAEREANQVELEAVETLFQYWSAVWVLKLHWLAAEAMQ